MSTLSNLLKQFANDIDSGNCNLSEEEALKTLSQLAAFNANNAFMSKQEACTFLNVSRPTFDRMVASGKIPHGKPRKGFKELTWAKSDLMKVLN